MNLQNKFRKLRFLPLFLFLWMNSVNFVLLSTHNHATKHPKEKIFSLKCELCELVFVDKIQLISPNISYSFLPVFSFVKKEFQVNYRSSHATFFVGVKLGRAPPFA